MKKSLFIFGFTLLCAAMMAQTPYFYYIKGEKEYLTLNTKYAFLSLKEQQLPADIQQRNIKAAEFLSDNSDRKQYHGKQGSRRYYTELRFDETLTDEQYLNMLSDIKRRNKDVIIAPYFTDSDNEKIGLSNFFLLS